MVKVVNSPKISPPVSPTPAPTVAQDTSIEAWIINVRQVLQFPLTILSVAGLLVVGAFAQTAPRKSLEFLNNYIGRAVFFILPIICGLILDWPTGLLAAVVSLIIFARLQKLDTDEGFEDAVKTELVPNSKRWFIETVLGESPIAISSDKIKRGYTVDEDARTSSSSAMSTSSALGSSGTSDGTSHK
jgi:hypothetical protein